MMKNRDCSLEIIKEKLERLRHKINKKQLSSDEISLNLLIIIQYIVNRIILPRDAAEIIIQNFNILDDIIERLEVIIDNGGDDDEDECCE